MQTKPFLQGLITTLIPSLVLLSSSPATAQDNAAADERNALAEAALSNDSLQLRYYDKKDSDSDSRLVAGGFLGEERDIVLTAAMMFPVDLGQHFDITFGPQLYAALLSEENEDVMAVSVGAELRWFIDSSRRFAVSGQAFYSPDILTFGSADNVIDLSARAEFRISDRIVVFGGMRWFEFNLIEDTGERILQEEVFVGARYRL
jgi:YfaZ precursor